MVVALLLLRFFDELASFLPAGALESFRADIGLSYAQAGAVLAAIGPGALLGNVAAVAADFVSRRLIVVAGALGYAGSMLLFAVGESFPVLLAAGALLGAASTAMVDAGEVALADLGGSRLRLLLARANLLSYLGALLGPLLLIVAAATGVGWRAAFALAAVLFVGYAAVLARHPIPRPQRAPDAPRPAGQLAAVLRDPLVWVLGGLSVLMNPLDSTIVGFAIAYLQQERDLTTALATTVAVIVTVGGIGGLLLAPRLEGHDDDHLLVASGVVMAASVAGFALLPGVVALVPMLGLGAGVAVGWVVMQHRILTARPGAAGTTKAVVSTVDALAFAAPVAIGLVADRWGLGAAMATFVALPVAYVLLAWLGIHLSRARHTYRDGDAGTPRTPDAD